MPYNVLGVNLNHNSSIALVSDGELILYLEEERLSRKKRDNNPYFLLEKYLPLYKIDQINFVGAGSVESGVNFTVVDMLDKMFSLKENIPKIELHLDFHHLTHAFCSFVHSGFKKATNIVIDGGGSAKGLFQEAESIFYFEQDNIDISKIYESNNEINKFNGITKTYTSVGLLFGFNYLDGGKLMGLSSYGKKDLSIPNFFINGKNNPRITNSLSFDTTNINVEPLNVQHIDFKQEIKDKTLSQIGKNIAYKVQQECQEEIAKLVEKSLQMNNCNNITISGGFGLNCVNNYYLTKRFPNVNFYFEPVSHDGGTAIGVAYLGCNKLHTNLESLYLGPKYSKKELLEGIKKYVDN